MSKSSPDQRRRAKAVSDLADTKPFRVATCPPAPRTTAPLRELPQKDQLEIIVAFETQSAEKVLLGLLERGIEVSMDILLHFHSWWVWRHQFKTWDFDVRELQRFLRSSQPGVSAEEVSDYGRLLFQVLALKAKNCEAFRRIETVRLHHVAGQLQREKFEFDAASACLEHLDAVREIKADPALAPNQKIEAVRRRLFGEAAVPAVARERDQAESVPATASPGDATLPAVNDTAANTAKEDAGRETGDAS